MADSAEWNSYQRRHVNLARAEAFQKALGELGYFRIPWPHVPHPTVKEPIPTKAALVYLLVDYLHITDKEKQLIALPEFLELVQQAYAIFEKEPRFPQK